MKQDKVFLVMSYNSPAVFRGKYKLISISETFVAGALSRDSVDASVKKRLRER